MSSISSNLVKICGPISEVGPTREQLGTIEDYLACNFRTLKVALHALSFQLASKHSFIEEGRRQHCLSKDADSSTYHLFGLSIPSLKETFEKTRRMVNAFVKVQTGEEFQEMAWVDTDIPPNDLRQHFAEFVEQFQENLAALKEEDLLFIPSGTFVHPLIFVVKGKAHDVCTFSIMNAVSKQASYFNVPKEWLASSSLIDHILTFAYATQVGQKADLAITESNFQKALKKFNEEIKKLFSIYWEYQFPDVPLVEQCPDVPPVEQCNANTTTCLQKALGFFAPKSLKEMYKKNLAIIVREVSKTHQETSGIALELKKYEGSYSDAKTLADRAGKTALLAVGLHNTLQEIELARQEGEATLKALRSEYQRIDNKASLAFHLLPYDIQLNSAKIEVWNRRTAAVQESRLSGHSSQEIYSVFKELVPDSLKGSFERGIKIEQAFSEAAKQLSSPGNLSCSIFDSLKAEIKDGIQKLKPGELFLIDGGTTEHAFVYVIKGNQDGTCTVSVVNTGFGSDFQENRVRAPTFKVPKELLLGEDGFIHRIIEMARITMGPSLPIEEWKEVFTEGMKKLLACFRELFEGYPESYFEHFHQLHGTCSASCLQVAIQAFAAPEVFRVFHLNSLKRICEEGDECKERLLLLMKKLPQDNLELFERDNLNELRTKINQLLHEIRNFLGNVRIVAESESRAAESESRAAATPTSSSTEMAIISSSRLATRVLSPSGTAAAIASPLTAAAEFKRDETLPKFLALEMA